MRVGAFKAQLSVRVLRLDDSGERKLEVGFGMKNRAGLAEIFQDGFE